MTEELDRLIIKTMSDYKSDRRQSTYNVLLYGPFGSGKTTSIATAVGPIWIDSFDPGGTKSLPPEDIKSGRIIIDSSFENEDDERPTAWDLWEKKFQEKKRLKLFERLGTYVIDSATLMMEACLNKVRKDKAGPASLPEYNLRIIEMRAALKLCLNLECNFILTAHPEYDKDEAMGRILAGPLSGKMKEKFPSLFDEVYVSVTKETSSGIQYAFMTRSSGLYVARTRIGRGGKFETLEKPDFKHLLKKAGLPYKDLPPLKASQTNI